jgi:hypothetical protein
MLLLIFRSLRHVPRRLHGPVQVLQRKVAVRSGLLAHSTKTNHIASKIDGHVLALVGKLCTE